MRTVSALVISPDGTVSGLYTDAVDLHSIGRDMHAKRASTVEWSDTRQEWVVEVDGAEIAAGTSREACIQAEVEFFAERMGV
jgi:hypothetical protein